MGATYDPGDPPAPTLPGDAGAAGCYEPDHCSVDGGAPCTEHLCRACVRGDHEDCDAWVNDPGGEPCWCADEGHEA